MGSTVENISHLLNPHPDPFWQNIRAFHHIYEYALATVSYGLNSWVIYMALTTKNRTMRNYCWVLLMSVFGDIMYTTFNFLSMTIVEVRAGKMYFLTMGPFIHSDYPYNLLMASLWLSGMYITVVTILMQFIYRYCALCKNPLTPVKFALIYGVCLTWSFGQGFAAFFCFDGHSVRDTLDLIGHPSYSYDPPSYTVGDPSNLRSFLHFFVSQMLVLFLYVIIVITGKRIQRRLNDEAIHMSKATKEAQEKLNQVMKLQATYPGVILGMPIVIATLITQLQLDAWWSGLYLATSISVIPLANSITVLVIIPSFRRRIMRYVHGLLVKGRVSDTHMSKTDWRTTHTTSDAPSREADDDNHMMF